MCSVSLFGMRYSVFGIQYSVIGNVEVFYFLIRYSLLAIRYSRSLRQWRKPGLRGCP
jgi:hypothetical protein